MLQMLQTQFASRYLASALSTGLTMAVKGGVSPIRIQILFMGTSPPRKFVAEIHEI